MEQKKKRNFIYLAGNISQDDRTYEWREKFTELMSDEPDVVIVNPCRNRFNQSMRKFGSNGMEFLLEAVSRAQGVLKPKDYQMISMCNLMVANLELVTPDKPLIGTIFELDWAKTIFHMPVIAITGGVTNAYTKHSWISDCCSAKVDTVEQAVKMVKDFFLEY